MISRRCATPRREGIFAALVRCVPDKPLGGHPAEHRTRDDKDADREPDPNTPARARRDDSAGML
jgi:hypothetical protein